MRKITPDLTEEILGHIGSLPVSKAAPYPIMTYRELVKQVAHLSYLNKDSLLFFRGQTQDFLTKSGSSTFYPSIYREDNLLSQEVNYRFAILDEASRQLKESFKKEKINGYNDVNKKRYIQWSILQHYNVCYTPLLDFTHSLRVACSFAQQDETVEKEVLVYVFGLPYVTNRITINSEHDLVNIRLLSICPPDALRPYFQEGYLAGTTDITNEYDSKSELDFNNRLIAKFIIPNTNQFWDTGLNKIPVSTLYPKNDHIEDLCKQIKNSLPIKLHPGEVGEFLTEWVQLEQFLLMKVKGQEVRPLSIRDSIRHLLITKSIDNSQAESLDELRKFRNMLVHESDKIKPYSIIEQISKLKMVKNSLAWDTE